MSSLYHLFREAAHRSPDATAVEHAGRAVSYRELDDMALRVASGLRALELQGPARAILQGMPSPELFGAYLGILHAGMTVVPLPSDMTAVSLAEVIRSSEASAVVVDAKGPAHGHLAADSTALVLEIGDLLNNRFPHPAVQAQGGDDAYLLFTSGSTGRPKGVVVRHESVMNYIAAVAPLMDLDSSSRTSGLFPLTFDLSVHDMFCTWLHGGCLVIPMIHDRVRPVEYARRARLTHWFSVPSMIAIAANSGRLTPGALPGLRTSAFCGEALSASSLDLWRAAAPNAAVVNLYGPTELTIACSAHRVPPGWPAASAAEETVSIGRPLEGSEFRVVDLVAGCDQPSGELVVRGIQRFRGYAKQSDNEGRFIRWEETAERWMDVASHDVRVDDFYRTGDLVEATGEGFTFRGRKDRQVKVRGYRVELDDVEVRLRAEFGITDVAVVWLEPTKNGLGVLVAVCGGEKAPERAVEHLRGRWPTHLTPQEFICWKELPKTTSGKVDHRIIAKRLRASDWWATNHAVQSALGAAASYPSAGARSGTETSESSNWSARDGVSNVRPVTEIRLPVE